MTATINNKSNNLKAAKANSLKGVKQDMGSDYAKELMMKLRDPDCANLKSKEMYENSDVFLNSGLTLPQFQSNMNRMKAMIGKFVENREHKFKYGTYLCFIHFILIFLICHLDAEMAGALKFEPGFGEKGKDNSVPLVTGKKCKTSHIAFIVIALPSGVKNYKSQFSFQVNSDNHRLLITANWPQ